MFKKIQKFINSVLRNDIKSHDVSIAGLTPSSKLTKVKGHNDGVSIASPRYKRTNVSGFANGPLYTGLNHLSTPASD